MFRSFARLAVLILAGITAFNPAGVVAQTADDYGDEVYQPSMGQPGKDVIWIPTPPALITALLRAAKVTKDDIVYDLGAGDGRIPIAAAQASSAHARSASSTTPTWRSLRGATRGAPAWTNASDHHRRHLQGEFLDRDRRHDVPAARPEPQAAPAAARDEARHAHRLACIHMGDWEPDEHLSVEARDGYLWYVPARVEGTWAFKEDGWGSEGTVTFVQRYQRDRRHRDDRRQDAAAVGTRAARRPAFVRLQSTAKDSCALRMSSSTGVRSRACLAGAARERHDHRYAPLIAAMTLLR